MERDLQAQAVPTPGKQSKTERISGRVDKHKLGEEFIGASLPCAP